MKSSLLRNMAYRPTALYIELGLKSGECEKDFLVRSWSFSYTSVKQA